jgi:hypothetical protein
VKLYDPADAAASVLTAIDHRLGLWIEAMAAVTLPLSGSVPPTTAIQLCTGWNLPGFPVEQSRLVRSALASIDGKYTRVFGHDLNDLSDPWEVYDVSAPDWANDLQQMQPVRLLGAGKRNAMSPSRTKARPFVEIVSPGRTPTEIPTVTFITDVLARYVATCCNHGRSPTDPTVKRPSSPFATGVTPVDNARSASLIPRLLNGAYEIRLTATDYAGWTVTTSVDVVVDGYAKVGNFTISLSI